MERKLRVKMRDVALAAGVSAMTVSRALQQDSRVAPETRQHVLSIIDTLGYVPDQIAASFSSQRSRFIAALVPSLNNPHFAETVRALSETLEAEGIQILLGQTNYQPEREERLVLELLRRRPEAIVLTADAHSPATRKRLLATDIPVIEIWDRPPDPISHTVGFFQL
jgi:LacI family transcriptional regulator, gluconate utilization system Gnt-I transcriptional repressor